MVTLKSILSIIIVIIVLLLSFYIIYRLIESSHTSSLFQGGGVDYYHINPSDFITETNTVTNTSTIYYKKFNPDSNERNNTRYFTTYPNSTSLVKINVDPNDKNTWLSYALKHNIGNIYTNINVFEDVNTVLSTHDGKCLLICADTTFSEREAFVFNVIISNVLSACSADHYVSVLFTNVQFENMSIKHLNLQQCYAVSFVRCKFINTSFKEAFKTNGYSKLFSTKSASINVLSFIGCSIESNSLDISEMCAGCINLMTCILLFNWYSINNFVCINAFSRCNSLAKVISTEPILSQLRSTSNIINTAEFEAYNVGDNMMVM